MEDKNVTVEEVKVILADDFDALAEEMAEAMNEARDGRIIADSEEPVRDAHGRFRQKAYEKAIGLLQARQEDFSPSAERASPQGQKIGDPPDGQRSGDG